MAKYARLDDAKIVIETFEHGDILPSAVFVPELAAQFIACPDNVESGFKKVAASWFPPSAPEPEPAEYPSIEPPKFYWLFTVEEQLQIEALKLSDPMLQLFFKRLDDPRLTGVDMGLQSVQDAIKYTLNKIHVGGYGERFAEIMTGVLR